jgi:MFS family permease
LPAVLAFTFLNSLGTGVVTSGIFFVTTQGYGFSDRENFVLGIVLGITYIIGAMGAGPLVRLLKRSRGLSDRTVLAWLMGVLAALCLVPIITQLVAPVVPHGSRGPLWPLWCMVGLYSALTGVLWPMVESFLTGGRTPPQQRSALGIWNVVWSSALVVAYWAISPFIGSYAPQTIALLGGMHLLAACCLVRFAPVPAPHTHDDHSSSQRESLARERSLLAVFRVLLPLSYVLSSALSPFLAGLLERLSVHADWRTIIASAWLVPRVIAFAVLHRWQAWYGTLLAPIIGLVLLLLGFCACTLASLAPAGFALPTIIAGLALFGLGMGTIYTGAISYAMRVGQSQVDAGGTHEALIGVGYLLGPTNGLLATVLAGASASVATSLSTASQTEPSTSWGVDRWLLLLTLGVVAVLLALAAVAGKRAASTAPRG